MPSLFRFLFVIGLVGGLFYGSMYVLAEYFRPQPKEITKTVRNVELK